MLKRHLDLNTQIGILYASFRKLKVIKMSSLSNQFIDLMQIQSNSSRISFCRHCQADSKSHIICMLHCAPIIQSKVSFHPHFSPLFPRQLVPIQLLTTPFPSGYHRTVLSVYLLYMFLHSCKLYTFI